MTHKRKHPYFFNATRLFFTHLTFYICGVLLYWYVFVQELMYSGNVAVPRSVFIQTGLARINFSLIWGLLILIHLGGLMAYRWWKQQQIIQVERNILRLDRHLHTADATKRLQTQHDDESLDDLIELYESQQQSEL